MIKHIIVWHLKPEAHGNTAEQNARLIKQKLEALQGRIPGMLKIEVGLDISRGAESGDLMLYSEFEDRKALDGYLAHPDHKAVFPFIAAARANRVIVDYEAD